MKKVESYRVDVSSYRISGVGMISNSEKGLVARLDAFNHFIGNVDLVEKRPYNGKDAVMIHYKNPNTQMERFIFFVNFNAADGLKNAVEEANKDLTASGVNPMGGMMDNFIISTPTTSSSVSTSAASSEQTASSVRNSTPAEAAAPSADVQLKLRKLQILLDSGILSQEEYEKEKGKIGV